MTFLSDDDAALPISSLTGDEVICVDRDLPAVEVAKRMLEAGIGAVGVGSAAQLDGVVTEHDFTKLVADGRDPAAVRACEMASRDLVWATSDSTIGEVSREMLSEWVRHILISEDGQLVGIVSARDLLSATAVGFED